MCIRQARLEPLALSASIRERYPTQRAANTSCPRSGCFWLLELRVSRTFLDRLRPQLFRPWIPNPTRRVDDGRPFPLGFRLSPHLSRSKFNVAESAFHELEPEESGMLSPLPRERRRSPRLQTPPNLADLEWRDRSQTRSSQGNILNISDHGALVFCHLALNLLNF